ncbi:SPOR domain-containing protein [Pseudophaeobacter sp.]|uniref:SPOR domain-containing protein n=1 Tax=Pseudophaeobacter sp. TaxID=1971739 RepID=UPI0032996D88
MAYFAQAGSGQPHSHDGTRNEAASDPYGQAPAGPRVTVQPHVTPRAVAPAPGSAGQPQAFAPQTQQYQQPQPQSLRQPPAPVSPFPVEGPDLHANYQPSAYEAAVPTTIAAPVAVPAEARSPQAQIHTQPQIQVQPRLQDYVSADYAVPGIGAQSYSEQSFDEQSYNAQEEAAQPSFAGAYGGAAEQSYGYAEEEAEDYGYDDSAAFATAPTRGGFARAASLFGAAASLALVVGLGAWGYQLVMRDVSGVPVVRAVEGPMRAQPENPGGSQADHQGLAVNSVAANGTAEAPADRLTLAPQPIELSQDDQPMSRLTAPEADLPPQEINPAPQQAEAQVSEASVSAYRNGDIDALVAELTDGVAPLGTLQDDASTAQAAPTPAPTPAIVQPEPLQPVEIAAVGSANASTPSAALRNAPGIKISLRPNLRPARFSPAAAQTAPGTGRATLEVDPSTLPAGTRLAQLGAYESAEVARAEWDRIYSRFEDYLEGKTRVIQRAESGGRTFYRLRAMGFDGLSDARRFCSALVAGKADCIPVTTR